MLVAYYDQQGKQKEDKYTLKDEVFAAKVNQILLAQAVETFWANQRQSNADVKDRGEVSGGGKKPWRQKGTGRARVGSNRSPIWKGGGKTFGPSNEINYTKKLSKSMRKAAIKAGFSSVAKNGGVVVYEGLKLSEQPKTKDLLKVLKNFKNDRVLIIQPENNEVLFNAAHNIKNVRVEVVNEVNVVDVLNAEKVIILEPAVEKIYEFWAPKKAARTLKKVSK